MKKTIIVLIFLISINFLLSQTENQNSGYNSASIYLYSGSLAGSEQLKIKTYIWGQVLRPGLYIVPDNTDLITLISSAGGPSEYAKLTKIRIIRPTNDGEKVIWVNLKKYMETGDESLIPVLMPGDTIVVAGTVFYAFTKVVEFLSDIAIVISVYTAVSNLK